MTYLLGELMTHEPITKVPPRMPPICVDVGETVSAAVEKMVQNKVGSVLITRDGKLAGIVTERDILRKVTAVRANPGELTCVEIMTPDPEVLSPDAPIAYALDKMGVGGFRFQPTYGLC